MADENAPNKPVHLVYLCGGLLLFYLLSWTIDWVWSFFTRYPSEFYVTASAALVALVAGIYFYRNQRVHTLVSEVTAELKKVTWPSAADTKRATIVVIVMTFISAAILGLFDLIWSKLTMFIYGG